jgi:hypothetical protein
MLFSDVLEEDDNYA